MSNTGDKNFKGYKAKIISLGCTVNYADTVRYKEIFARYGIALTESIESADFCLVNTCTVTLKANRKSRNLIRKVRKTNPSMKLIISGCYSAVSPEEVEESLSCDFQINRAEGFAELEQYLGELTAVEKAPPLDENSDNFNAVNPIAGRTRMFLKIQDGCNKFCSFCIIPRARGREFSRPIKEIIEEATHFAKKGFMEFCLAGICLGRYGKDKNKPNNNREFIKLLEELEKVPGLKRIRFGSIDAVDMDEEFFQFIATYKPFCQHFHIPLQSGSDIILKKMRRQYSQKEFLQKIHNLRKILPDASLATDVIVGFPTETDDDFNETLFAIKEAGFSRLHVFPYSHRPGTVAASLKNEVATNTIFERNQKLQKLNHELQSAYYSQKVGQQTKILIENIADGIGSGHTSDYCLVRFPFDPDSAEKQETVINTLRSVKLLGVEKLHLTGELI